MKKKSILFVNGHLQIGGVEKALVDLLSWIDFEKYDVDLLLLEGEGDYRNLVPEQVHILHKDMRELEGPFWGNLWKNLSVGKFGNISYRIINVLAKNNKKWLRLAKPLLPVKKHYDVGIAFRPGRYADVVAFSLCADLKVCWWHHGSVPVSENQRKELSFLLGCFDKVIAVSDGCKNLLGTSLYISPKYVEVIPNIIDSDKIYLFAKGEDPFGNDRRLRIVTLCRFAPEKHLEDAVEAASMLQDNLDFVWYLIGDGTEFRMVKDKIEKSGLGDRVVLTGSLTNPYPYLKYADLMVHPSHIESLCISVLEAMALRVPCLVVRSLGPESFIEDGVNGFLIPEGPEAICHGILMLSELPVEQLDEIRQRAAKTVETSFSPEAVIPLFERLIEESHE